MSVLSQSYGKCRHSYLWRALLARVGLAGICSAQAAVYPVPPHIVAARVLPIGPHLALELRPDKPLRLPVGAHDFAGVFKGERRIDHYNGWTGRNKWSRRP